MVKIITKTAPTIKQSILKSSQGPSSCLSSFSFLDKKMTRYFAKKKHPMAANPQINTHFVYPLRKTTILSKKVRKPLWNGRLRGNRLGGKNLVLIL